MDEIILKNENGQILASSREVADRFGKNHKDVLESIRNLTAENSAVKDMFQISQYTNSRGRNYDQYLMNRDGFSLLAMGFTGKKALEWKLKYINAFNMMEEKLNHPYKLPSTYKEALIQLVEKVEEKRKQKWFSFIV